MEVVNEPDLLLGAVGGEADAAAAEHKLSQLCQVRIVADKLLDALSVLVEGRDKEFLEDDELIHVFKGEGEPVEELIRRDAVQLSVAALEDFVLALIEDVWSQSAIVVQQELCKLINTVCFIAITIAILTFTRHT